MDKLASLGIDPWSMLLYLINTGTVLVILTYFLYKPILKYVDQRRKTIKDSIEEAQKLQETFEKRLEESEKKRQAAEDEFKSEIEQLHKYTDQKKAELISEMEVARGKMMQKAQSEIDEKKAQIIKDAEKEVMSMMTKIILNIVENKVPANVIEESVKSGWKAYNK